MTVLIAREPILDTDDRVVAYALTFHETADAAWGGGRGDPTRSAHRAYRKLGLLQLANGHRVFVPVGRELLIRGGARALPREDLVLCIPASAAADPVLVDAVARLASSGHWIALDDQGQGSVDPDLLPHARYALVDLAAATENGDCDPGRAIADAGVMLVASAVGDQDARRLAIGAGCALFRGQFLAAAPEATLPRACRGNGATVLALIAELNEPDFDLERAYRLIRTDPALAYRLLRYINSAFFSLPREVESIRQAVMLLGSDHIRRFVSIVALAQLGEDRPEELLRTAIVRARLCELLAPRRGPELFTAGLFSVLDALLELPLERALEDLPLASELTEALLRDRGPLAPYLSLARSYHAGRWDRVSRLLRRLKLDEERLPAHYREAIGWADAVFEIEEEEEEEE